MDTPRSAGRSLVAVVQLAALLAGCGSSGLMLRNPLTTGQVQPNRVVIERNETEQFREVAPGTLASSASLASLDQQRVCFDVSVKWLPDTVQPLELRTAEIVLGVDGTRRGGPPEFASTTNVAATVPGTVPKIVTVDEMKCMRHNGQGDCLRKESRPTRQLRWPRGQVEVIDSQARVCFRDHGITTATKQILLNVNVPERMHDELTLGRYENRTEIRQAVYRWTFDPKGEGTIGAQPPTAAASEPAVGTPVQNPSPTPAGASTPLAPAGDRHLADTIAAHVELKTFSRHLTHAGLAQTLQEDGPFTVCATTDSAFAQLTPQFQQALASAPPDKLRAALGRMIVRGAHPSASLGNLEQVRTLDPTVQLGFGKRSDGTVQICDRESVRAEIAARNGVLYIVEPKR